MTFPLHICTVRTAFVQNWSLRIHLAEMIALDDKIAKLTLYNFNDVFNILFGRPPITFFSPLKSLQTAECMILTHELTILNDPTKLNSKYNFSLPVLGMRNNVCT